MVEDKIDEEVYPEGAKSFVFETGSMVDTFYGCIPINAANKSGALIAINELLSVSTQINKYDPSNWGNLPVLSLNLLSEENLEAFDKVSIKRSTLSVQDLQPVGIYEYPLQVQEWIIDIWVEEISK
jgi:putative spermidine/putrescine transport system substrate-binding protein